LLISYSWSTVQILTELICLLSSDGAFGDPESSLEIQEKITKPGYDRGFVQTPQNITEPFSTTEDTRKVQKMAK
jgi:hypothetical protein